MLSKWTLTFLSNWSFVAKGFVFAWRSVCSSVWLAVEERSAAVRSSHRPRTQAAGVLSARSRLARREVLPVTAAPPAVKTEWHHWHERRRGVEVWAQREQDQSTEFQMHHMQFCIPPEWISVLIRIFVIKRSIQFTKPVWMNHSRIIPIVSETWLTDSLNRAHFSRSDSNKNKMTPWCLCMTE